MCLFGVIVRLYANDKWLLLLDLVICISVSSLCNFVGCFSWIWFCFLSTGGQIGWEEGPLNDLVSVEWDVKL